MEALQLRFRVCRRETGSGHRTIICAIAPLRPLTNAPRRDARTRPFCSKHRNPPEPYNAWNAVDSVADVCASGCDTCAGPTLANCQACTACVCADGYKSTATTEAPRALHVLPTSTQRPTRQPHGQLPWVQCTVYTVTPFSGERSHR